MAEFVRAYEGKKPYLFVSYSHEDSDLVQSYIQQMHDQKYRVWYDEGIAPGSEWPKNIADHLKGCTGVLIYVSQASLKSPNCRNEVARALELHKEIIEISLDGNKHPRLDDTQLVDKDQVLSQLDSKYIGDGTGYDRQLVKGKHSGLWIALICLAALLIIGICVGLYGVKEGWFDKYLPGLNTQVVQEIEKVENEVQIKDSKIAEAVAEYAQRSDLNVEIELSGEVRDDFYYPLGIDLNETLTYNTLKNNQVECLELNYCHKEYLELLTYLPNLTELTIKNADTSDFSILGQCKNLQKVNIAYSLFPITFPENCGFEVHVIDYKNRYD